MSIIILYIYVFNISNSWFSRYMKLYLINPNHYKELFESTKPVMNKEYTQKNDETIMVSIASYRDNQCADTINNIIQNADKPSKLRIVVCQQNALQDEDCMKRVKNKSVPIKVIKLTHHEAKGPNYARYLIQKQYRGENFFLQIDSHTRLIPHWDTKLKKELQENTILTQYPLEFKNITDKDKRGDSILEGWAGIPKIRGPLMVEEFDRDGIIRFQSKYINERPNKPQTGVGIASGFIFTYGSFNNKIKMDPYLYLFFGEQMDLAIRSFKNGYDLKSPTETIAYHIYDRSYRPKWLKVMNTQLETLSLFRLYVKYDFLKKEDIPNKYKFILNDLETYNYGNSRTLQDYEEQAKINIKKEIMS